MAETTKERLNKQFAQLESERQSFEPHWRELSDYINPRGSRLLRLPSRISAPPFFLATSRISIRLLVRMVSGLLIWLTPVQQIW